MKTISALTALLFVSSVLFAGGGIEFTSGNFNSAKTQAKAEDKLLLLDFTASWCFPCKKMEKDVFPDNTLGTFVNENFVSFKVNADYFWGMDIADEYQVKAYPTILIIDNAGKIVKRITGYQSADNLMEHLQPLGDFNRLFTSD